MDMFERGEETAYALRSILVGSVQPKAAYVKVPLTPPTATLLTRTGPYADIIDFGQRRKRELNGKISTFRSAPGSSTQTQQQPAWPSG